MLTSERVFWNLAFLSLHEDSVKVMSIVLHDLWGPPRGFGGKREPESVLGNMGTTLWFLLWGKVLRKYVKRETNKEKHWEHEIILEGNMEDPNLCFHSLEVVIKINPANIGI